jgi:hypothetical protein
MTFHCTCNTTQCLGGIVYFLKKSTFANSSSFAPLSLRSYQSKSSFSEGTKENAIEQYYVNEFIENIEAFYALPVKKDINIVILNIKIDGEKFSEVVTKEEGITKHHVSNRYVIDWPDTITSTETNIFKMALGILKPGSGVEIELKYLSKLSSEKEFELTDCYELDADDVCPKYDSIQKVNFSGVTQIHQDRTDKCDDDDDDRGDDNHPRSCCYDCYELDTQSDAICPKYDSIKNVNLWGMTQIDQDGIDKYDDDDENKGDDDHPRSWHDRPWGDFGKVWGDFGPPWKKNRRPWGHYISS